MFIFKELDCLCHFMENIIYKEHKRTRVLFIKKFFKESFKIWDFISYYNTDEKIILLVFRNDKVYLIDYDGMESLVNIDLKDISNVKEDNFKEKSFLKGLLNKEKVLQLKFLKPNI